MKTLYRRNKINYLKYTGMIKTDNDAILNLKHSDKSIRFFAKAKLKNQTVGFSEYLRRVRFWMI